MKIALFDIGNGYRCGHIAAFSESGYSPGVRLSEYIEVEFPPLKPEQVIPEMLAVIDRHIAQVTKEFTEKLNELKTQRANLLAICDQREIV
jgi:hypothetical protein